MSGTKTLRTMMIMGVCATLLTGCSWITEWPSDGSSKSALAPPPPPPPQARVVQTADSTWMEPVAAVQPVERLIPPAPERDREDADAVQRIAELEQEVANLRNDISKMIPAMTRLAAAQTDLQGMLASTIQPAAGSPAAPVMEPAAPPVAAAVMDPVPVLDPLAMQTAPETTYQARPPMPVAPLAPRAPSAFDRSARGEPVKLAALVPAGESSVPVAAAPARHAAPAMPPSAGTVRQIRLGEHADKTRIVLDTGDEVAYRYDLDNNERILIVELPGTVWAAQAQQVLQSAPLVASYHATPDGRGGTHLAIQLKQQAQVLRAQSIPPTSEAGARIVLDVAGL